MTTKIYYIAFDGEEFETEQECLDHERAANYKDSLVFLDNWFEIIDIDDSVEAFENAIYVYVLDGEKAGEFFAWLDNYAGYTGPKQLTNHTIYYYDECSNGLENLNSTIEDLVAKRDKILSKVTERMVERYE